MQNAPAISRGLRSTIGLATLPLFVLTLFISSALLALIEPMFAKMVLPLLGGTPAVWNTCLVFFQATLLGGYAYGHWSIQRLRTRHQAALHIILMLSPLFVLPVAIPAGWTPPVAGNPVGWLLLLLSVAVGLPYFAVSTSAPIIQRWFSTTAHRAASDPYFLYAASSLGSMLGLLAYPSLVEPFLGLNEQCRLWTIGYLVLVGLTIACTFCLGSDVGAKSQSPVSLAIAPRRRLRWILLAFIPSSQLLGVTTFLTSDIAAVPLFWILPLALYFLSFILVFTARPIIPHRLMVRLLPIVMLSLALFMMGHVAQPIGLVMTLHLAALFISSMVCHGELAKDRPPTDRLTEFYLILSVGGVCGGLFNALLAPLLFHSAAEYPIALVLACFVCPIRPYKSSMQSMRWGAMDVALPAIVGLLAWGLPRAMEHAGITRLGLVMVGLGIPVMLTVSTIRRSRRFAAAMALMLMVAAGHAGHGELLAIHRSFFGIDRVVRIPDGPLNALYHGTTIHGTQHVGADRSPIAPQQALSYFFRTGPIGQLLSTPGLLHSTQRVDVVGLGVGSLAAYAQAGTQLTYFEIDPVVRWAAEDSGYFTFLGAARARGADIRVVLGDARLTLGAAPSGACDLLVLDAFSGDAVPVHLLTRQSMQIYKAKLAEHGVLAMHVSNMYLDLLQVTSALAADGGWASLYQNDLDLTPEQAAEGKLPSQWVVMARSAEDLSAVGHDARWLPLPTPTTQVWTDDFSNILGVFRWHAEKR